ncbi:hypothetical protein [Granulicella arctica]|uniref:Uncharacterized protein n=1 Tax=Granulicella arctica TaxID=940613 RepID=A0A7Y9PEH5_9BACT|nr:hypothetical protein [Granulicella arctica]NYF78421.1 hypothetical protein [Granulicella arctica]
MATLSNAPTPSEPTISDIEKTVQEGLEALRNAPLSEQITAALKFLTPPGYRPVAQLEEDGRKKRSTAAASNWNPQTGEIVIYFEPLQQESSPLSPMQPAPQRTLQDVHPAFARMNRDVETGHRLDPLLVTEAERPRLASARVQRVAGQPTEPLVAEIQIQQLCLALAEAEKEGRAFIALKKFRDNELTAHNYVWAESLAHRQAVLSRAIDLGAVMTTQIPNPRAPQHPTTTIKLNRESSYAQVVPPRYQPIRTRGGEAASEILLRDRGRF